MADRPNNPVRGRISRDVYCVRRYYRAWVVTRSRPSAPGSVRYVLDRVIVADPADLIADLMAGDTDAVAALFAPGFVHARPEDCR